VVRARWLCPGLAALAFAPALAGCGGVGTSPAAQSVGKQLTVYSSLPLQGPAAGISQQIVGGEKLALADADGRVGPFTVSYVSLDDSSPTSGQWDPGVTAANAKAAAQDRTTIAYLGDFNSGATAVSLPLTNAAGILQVSPASPYVGLTSSLDAGQGEPERFYLAGRRTFGRVAPGDPVQAAAQVELLRRLGVRRLYVIADQDPFDGPLAQIVASDAQRAGIEVKGQDTVTILPGSSFTGEVAKVAEDGVQAVFLSATATSQAALLARQLHAAVPGLSLLGSSALLSTVFTSKLGAGESATFLGSPVLAAHQYPSSAQPVLASYSHHFAASPQPYVLYGYEAMSVVLAAIRSAGERGDNRQVVIDRFFATHGRASVLGVYSMRSSGETTLSSYAIDRVVKGEPVLWRAFQAPR
jgi:branched-chain amino acid transport system substrate-binding protein